MGKSEKDNRFLATLDITLGWHFLEDIIDKTGQMFSPLIAFKHCPVKRN